MQLASYWSTCYSQNTKFASHEDARTLDIESLLARKCIIVFSSVRTWEKKRKCILCRWLLDRQTHNQITSYFSSWYIVTQYVVRRSPIATGAGSVCGALNEREKPPSIVFSRGTHRRGEPTANRATPGFVLSSSSVAAAEARTSHGCG
jgi:hypothetical protein